MNINNNLLTANMYDFLIVLISCHKHVYIYFYRGNVYYKIIIMYACIIYLLYTLHRYNNISKLCLFERFGQ